MSVLKLATVMTLGVATSASAATLQGSTGNALGVGGTSLTIFGDLGAAANSTGVDLLGGTLSAIAYRPVVGVRCSRSTGPQGG